MEIYECYVLYDIKSNHYYQGTQKYGDFDFMFGLSDGYQFEDKLELEKFLKSNRKICNNRLLEIKTVIYAID